MTGVMQRIGTRFLHRTLSGADYWLTRFVLLRVLGFVYFFAFLSLAQQVIPLLGSNGLHPVNTYGAFGSITKERNELVFQGTADETVTNTTMWEEYDFPGKPGPIDETLPMIAPYQPRMDWQLWFAALQQPAQNPWIAHVMWKLLHNDEAALRLLEHNPFPDKPPL